MDNELQASVSALNALATLPSADEADLATFRDRAQRILATQPQWVNVNLARPDGQQVMNLQVPPGAPLPNIGELDGSFARLRQTGKPVVSDLAVGPVLKRWSFAVRVPVFRDGMLTYVLSGGVTAESISAVIRAQGLPADWVGVIVDAGGLALAAQSPPEVALIDIGLPDMDGYELARRLRSASGCEGLPMVAITGYGRPEDRQRAVDAGFAAHLTKPVTPERLRRALAGLR